VSKRDKEENVKTKIRKQKHQVKYIVLWLAMRVKCKQEEVDVRMRKVIESKK
jgi:hypothetical protein